MKVFNVQVGSDSPISPSSARRIKYGRHLKIMAWLSWGFSSPSRCAKFRHNLLDHIAGCIVYFAFNRMFREDVIKSALG